MKNRLLLIAFLLPLHAHAELTAAQEEADCRKIREYAAKGDEHYQQKQYSKAREQYESQVAWSESCDLPDGNIATAYNNVAMTYIREGDFLKANAWLSIAPDDKKSIFNHNKIKDDIERARKSLSESPAGEYWLYAGKSMWNAIKVTAPESGNYRMEFQGYYAGLVAMYGGINIGEFETTLPIKDGRAHFDMSKDDDHLDCVYDFIFSGTTLTANRLSGSNCGFGHNVSADGTYQKVGG